MTAFFILAGLVAMLISAAPVFGQADYVLVNARIYTADPDAPMVEALAVGGGRILRAGAASDLLAAFPDAPRLDAEGRSVIPGLIDAHAHLMGLGLSMMQADLVGTASPEEVIARLREYARTLSPDEWLLGRGWDQNLWPRSEFPTRQDLDAAFPERPVWLRRIDGHAGWANSAALRRIGLDRLTGMPDPDGGRILHAPDGAPTGVFIDAAMHIVDRVQLPLSEERLSEALQMALGEAARYGLTGVHDAGVDLADLRRYRQAIDGGRFPLRVYAMIGGRGETFDHFCRNGPLLDYKDRLSVRSVKYFIDGALGSRGAAMLDDYSDAPGNKGLLMKPVESFEQDVLEAIRCGFQVNTHAIGDRGNRVALDAYEKAIARTGFTEGRHRIEHAQIVAPEDIPRFAQLGIIASMQPTHATSDMGWAEDRLGPLRIRTAYAWRLFLDSGVRPAFGSDFPVEHVNPLLGFYAAVTRQDAAGRPAEGWLPDQRLTRREALHAFTRDAAWAAFQEHDRGSLTPGKWADFVVLSRDIMTIPAGEIPGTEVIATYLGGEAVYGGLAPSE